MGAVYYAHTALTDVLFDDVAVGNLVTQLKLEIKVTVDICGGGNAEGLATVETNTLFALYRRRHHDAEATVSAGHLDHGRPDTRRGNEAHEA